MSLSSPSRDCVWRCRQKPVRQTPAKASPQKRKSPEEAAPSTASIAGAGVIANAEAEAGVTAKAPRGDDTGGPSRKTVVVRPPQADIDAGVATSVREYMEALIPSVQENLTAFLKQRTGFTGTLAEAPPLTISACAQKALKNFHRRERIWINSSDPLGCCCCVC